MKTAVLLIDIINPFDFDGATDLVANARRAFANIVKLKKVAAAAGWPIVYVNDNFGHWQESLDRIVARATGSEAGAPKIVSDVIPDAEDFFVLKPRLSGFHASPLDILLRQLGITEVLLAGIATDKCVLATALDAHMLGYSVGLVSDCVAAESKEQNAQACVLLQEATKAKIKRWSELSGRTNT